MTGSEDSDLARRRYYSLGLGAVSTEAPADVVKRLGAMQSQDYGPAKWSIGHRTGTSNNALDQLFDEGRLIRTHVLRPTWHFVHPDDLRLLLALTGKRVHMINGFMYRQEGLDDTTRGRTEEVLARTLEGHVHLTRPEIARVLEQNGIVAERFRLAYLLMSAELNGVICSGARREKEHTYALVDERIGQAPQPSADDALKDFTRRYFASHGPATTKDFGWWSSLKQSEIKRGLHLAGSQLVGEEVDGVEYWSTPKAPLPATQSPQVHLVQGYDEYIVGYSHSKRLLNLRQLGKAKAGVVAWNGVVLLNGQVAGQWKPTPKRDLVQVDVALYEPFDDAATSALQGTTDEYGRFLGTRAEVRVNVI